MPRLSRLLAAIGFLIAAPLFAGVGDPTIETAHPQYPGEGAFQTVEQCVARATAGKTEPQDKAIAMFQWLLTHQFHLMSPQEFCIPGQLPDTRKDTQEMIVYDANRSRFSYGYGLCGTVHAWNEPYWKALGMNARRRSFPGHTNSEIEYGGSWHTFDTDMAGLVFRKDGIVAGYEDIIKDPNLINVDKSPLPRYPFAWPGDFNAMKNGWKEIAKGGNWYKMYNSGYAAQPGIVNLRSGETFTRYFDRDHFGGEGSRLYWHNQKGGPFRDWTFVNMGEPIHNGAKSNSLGNASYCNGEFIYKPNLKPGGNFQEGVAVQTPSVMAADSSPHLRSEEGSEGSITFQHFSPYVIAGNPVDGANPMSATAKNGFVVRGEAVGTVTIAVSADRGQTWHAVGEVTGKFEKDLTDQVKGHYGWYVNFSFKGKSGLNALTFTTITQVAQTIYPRLKADGCAVTYRAGSRAVMPILPDFGQPENVASRDEEKSLRSANMVWVGRSAKSRLAYQVEGPKAGTVGFRIEAPASLVQVSAAARFNVRVPPAEGSEYRMEVSTDEGKTWKPLGGVNPPADNEYSSAWMYGNADVAAAKAKSAWVRLKLYGGGTFTGLITTELYGVYATPPPAPVKLTYAWKEGGVVKTNVENVPAGKAEHKFIVPTGKQITDEYVRIEVP